MKLLKSRASMKAKEPMDAEQGAASYQVYQKFDGDPAKPDAKLLFYYVDEKTEGFYHWEFYEEVQANPNKDKKQYKGKFEGEMQQERYEFYCAGWVDFYDKVIKVLAYDLGPVEHKLFFFWDKKGVSIYVNDERAVINKDKTIDLKYTPATVTGDPPTIPPPPPPSAK